MDISHRRQPQLEKDIFGNEYLGAKKVFSLTFDTDELSERAGKFMVAALTMHVSNTDIARVISDALVLVPADFWQRKVEELAPFEWKLIQALEDMDFRKKVQEFLDEASVIAARRQTEKTTILLTPLHKVLNGNSA